MINVTIWNEYVEEKQYSHVHDVYPDGIHKCIGHFLEKQNDISVNYATLDMPEHGLTEEVLKKTDVLIWWGHQEHDKVSNEVAERVKKYILRGMGFIPLHSSHQCKVLILLLGTTLSLRWNNEDTEKLICVNPGHPIAEGITKPIFLDKEEMYGEYFDIPKPDDIVFLGWFGRGEVFRSGCTFTRGYGKIFYFQPGHEEYPIYYNENIQKIIVNAVRWAKPVNRISNDYDCIHVE